jgi:alpha-glucosidase (family GH31 glycosyl hydrolase)
MANELVLDVGSRGRARTGSPRLPPEWAYDFWKSRDVHEHQDDVLDDFHGFRRHEIPLDAIVIDSPWATQYNTWEFNPHQFPDARGMIAELRADGVRTVVGVTPWVNLDSRDGQIPPQPASERLHREPAPNYAPAADAGLFVREPAGKPFVSQWWMGTGSPVDFTNPAAEQWWRELARGLLSLGVEGIKADDGEGYYSGPLTRFIRAPGSCSGAAVGAASRRSVSHGAGTRPRISGRWGCLSWPR